jgi:hypothetical protein
MPLAASSESPIWRASVEPRSGALQDWLTGSHMIERVLKGSFTDARPISDVDVMLCFQIVGPESMKRLRRITATPTVFQEKGGNHRGYPVLLPMFHWRCNALGRRFNQHRCSIDGTSEKLYLVSHFVKLPCNMASTSLRISISVGCLPSSTISLYADSRQSTSARRVWLHL